MIEPVFKVKEEGATDTFSQFVIEPLEPGYGHTMGNALRRLLLTSIAGAAVTSVKISGVKHRFSTVEGLKENVVELLLNLKGVNFRLSDGKTSATVRLSLKGPKDITAGDLELSEGIEVSNKDHYIGSLSDKKAKLDMELTVEKGYGYSLAEERKLSTLGVIPTDAVFTPVERVTYEVSATRVGRQTNLDRLTMSVWTSGVVSPKDALMHAAKILSTYFLHIYEPKATVVQTEGVVIDSGVSEELTRMTIDELDLPTRIYNSLRNGGVETVGQLVTTPRKTLMTMRNMGGKSVTIIEEKLTEKGVSLAV